MTQPNDPSRTPHAERALLREYLQTLGKIPAGDAAAFENWYQLCRYQPTGSERFYRFAVCAAEHWDSMLNPEPSA